MARKKPVIEVLGPDRLLNAAETMEMLHIGHSMLYWLIARGDLPTVRIRHALRFRFQDVQAYIQLTNAQRSKPPGPNRKG